jgi:hypothetical protein
MFEIKIPAGTLVSTRDGLARAEDLPENGVFAPPPSGLRPLRYEGKRDGGVDGVTSVKTSGGYSINLTQGQLVERWSGSSWDAVGRETLARGDTLRLVVGKALFGEGKNRGPRYDLYTAGLALRAAKLYEDSVVLNSRAHRYVARNAACIIKGSASTWSYLMKRTSLDEIAPGTSSCLAAAGEPARRVPAQVLSMGEHDVASFVLSFLSDVAFLSEDGRGVAFDKDAEVPSPRSRAIHEDLLSEIRVLLLGLGVVTYTKVGTNSMLVNPKRPLQNTVPDPSTAKRFTSKNKAFRRGYLDVCSHHHVTIRAIEEKARVKTVAVTVPEDGALLYNGFRCAAQR